MLESTGVCDDEVLLSNHVFEVVHQESGQLTERLKLARFEQLFLCTFVHKENCNLLAGRLEQIVIFVTEVPESWGPFEPYDSNEQIPAQHGNIYCILVEEIGICRKSVGIQAGIVSVLAHVDNPIGPFEVNCKRIVGVDRFSWRFRPPAAVTLEPHRPFIAQPQFAATAINDFGQRPDGAGAQRQLIGSPDERLDQAEPFLTIVVAVAKEVFVDKYSAAPSKCRGGNSNEERSDDANQQCNQEHAHP